MTIGQNTGSGTSTDQPLALGELDIDYLVPSSNNLLIHFGIGAGFTKDQEVAIKAAIRQQGIVHGVIAGTLTWGSQGRRHTLCVNYNQYPEKAAEAAFVAEFRPHYAAVVKLRASVTRDPATHVVILTQCNFDLDAGRLTAVNTDAIAQTSGVAGRAGMAPSGNTIGFVTTNASTNWDYLRGIMLSAANAAQLLVVNADDGARSIIQDETPWLYSPDHDSEFDKNGRQSAEHVGAADRI